MTVIKNSNKVYQNENMLTVEAFKGEDVSVFLKIYDRLAPTEAVDLAQYNLSIFAESLYRERFPDINMVVTWVADAPTNNVVHVTLAGLESAQYIFESRAFFYVYGTHKVTGVKTCLLNGFINFLN